MSFYLVAGKKLDAILDGDIHDLPRLVEECKNVEIPKLEAEELIDTYGDETEEPSEEE